MNPAATIDLPCPAGCGVPVAISYTLSAPFRIHDGTFQATVQVDWDAVAPEIEAHCMANPEAHPEQCTPEGDESHTGHHARLLPGSDRPDRRRNQGDRMSAPHSEDCVYSGQAERCNGTCVRHEEEAA